jgi:hydrogenase 3 maturation protease
MCIGNRDGGDDSVGPYISDKLKKIHNKDFFIIDCETVPENYTSVVKNKKPKNLIIIDAVEMGLIPGEIRIIPKEKIGVMHISTHGIPISVLINYIEKTVKNIIFIGIQPKKMSGKMTKIVKLSADKLIDLIKNEKTKNIKVLN